MSSPTTNPKEPKPLPVTRMIVIFGVVGALSLVFMGARQLVGGLALKSVPIVGEWRAVGKAWRIEFHPDKTISSLVPPNPPKGAEPSASSDGVYSIDYFGTLWVKLNNGKVYTATLSSETPSRIDLIDSSTEGVTMFQRGSVGVPSPTTLDKK